MVDLIVCCVASPKPTVPDNYRVRQAVFVFYSDAEQILSMEEEALKIADYISKRRAKMKPSLRSLTNLGKHCFCSQ